ncbi:MAG: IS4 family transposase, partial [Methylococcales bacterium]|nr:IS4 family transposase [Methylococcales bacterium]
HQKRAWERVSQHDRVLAVQDTTFLNYTHFPATKGLGPIGTNAQKQHGIVMHNTLAVTPEGLPLGEIQQQLWVRPEVEEEAEEAKPKAQKQVRPIEEKESYKWVESMCKIQAHIPENTEVVTVCDAESDVYELLAVAQTCQALFLIRAAQDRSLQEPATTLIRQCVLQEKVKANLKITVAAKKQAPARTVTVAVRYRRVKLKPPQRAKGLNFCPIPLPSVAVYAILVREINPPAGATPVEWLLLTNVPVNSIEDALERIDWYCQRWQVEIFHRILKSGCRIEHRRLNHFDRLRPCIALFTIIAWRIHWMTWLMRTQPDAPCTHILAESEWQALYTLATRSSHEP